MTKRTTPTRPRLMACALAAASSASWASPPPLRCTVEAPARVVAGEAVPLRFTLRNEGAAPLLVLRWNSPFEGAWLAPFVTVTRDGRALPYQGAMVKRAEPGPDSYLRLEPQATATAEIDLAPAFDVTAPGRYRVQPKLQLVDVRPVDAHASQGDQAARPRAEHEGMALVCNAVSFQVAAR